MSLSTMERRAYAKHKNRKSVRTIWVISKRVGCELDKPFLAVSRHDAQTEMGRQFREALSKRLATGDVEWHSLQKNRAIIAAKDVWEEWAITKCFV